MKLIACRACGKQVSADARACPLCGQPHPAPVRLLNAQNIVALCIMAPLAGWLIVAFVEQRLTPAPSATPRVAEASARALAATPTPTPPPSPEVIKARAEAHARGLAAGHETGESLRRGGALRMNDRVLDVLAKLRAEVEPNGLRGQFAAGFGDGYREAMRNVRRGDEPPPGMVSSSGRINAGVELYDAWGKSFGTVIGQSDGIVIIRSETGIERKNRDLVTQHFFVKR